MYVINLLVLFNYVLPVSDVVCPKPMSCAITVHNRDYTFLRMCVLRAIDPLSSVQLVLFLHLSQASLLGRLWKVNARSCVTSQQPRCAASRVLVPVLVYTPPST